MKTLAALLLLSVMSTPLIADSTSEETTGIDNTQTGYSSPAQTRDELAAHWNLTLDEVDRYTRIMDTEGRYHWTHLDPIFVLGMYANSDEKRRYYADRYAQDEYRRTDQLLAFNNAYHLAFNRRYGDEKKIDMSILQSLGFSPQITTQTQSTGSEGGIFSSLTKTIEIDVATGDHLLLFIDPSDNASYNAYQAAHAKKGAGVLDLFFINATDQQIRTWAKTNGVDSKAVMKGHITLNHDDGRLTKLGKSVTPALFVQKGKELYDMVPE